MIRPTLHALMSHWRAQPLQCLTLVLGLALATALFSGVQAINSEARSAYAQASDAVSGPGPVVEHAQAAPISQAQFIALRRAGWMVSPMLEGRARIAGKQVRLVGIDPLTAPQGSRAGQAALSQGDGAGFLTGDALFAAPNTAADLADDPRIRAIDGLAPGLVFADIGVAQNLLERAGEIDRLLLHDTQPLSRPPLAEIAPALQITAAAAQNDLARLTDSFHLNLTAFGLLSFAVGLFIVHATIGLAFEQRRAMFRTLRALGVPARLLVTVLLAELGIFAVVAGLLGTALGYLIAAALLPDVAATLTGLYGANVDGTLTFRANWWLTGMAIAILGTALASANALQKLARLPVLAPAKPRAWAMASDRSARLQALSAVGLLTLAGLGVLFGKGVIAGFATLGALMIGAAFALPLILRLCVGAAERFATGVRTQWFWADTRQQIPGLSLALMALLLALATNIGVGTMVSSFRLTFTGWLDQRLASELYVRASDPEQSIELQDWLATRTDAVLPLLNTETQILGRQAEMFGVADHPTYRDNWPLLDALPGVWDRVASGEAILINEQLSLRETLGPGDSLRLAPDWTALIAGVYSDYGNPRIQVLVNTQIMAARFPDLTALQFALRVPPDQVADLTEALVNRFDLGSDAVIDQASIKAFSLEVFERTFTVSATLNVLTLSVAGFAILTSLLTLSGMRLPQLAPVWALGMTHGSLAKLELLRAVLLAAMTLIAAVPLGLALAWVLLNVINVEAFGWRLPMYLFPSAWGLLAFAALAAAVLASLWPAWRLYKTPPAHLLKVFVNER